MEKRIEFEPAWDKRDPDPNKNYGIHGVSCRFYLIGEHGSVQFVIYTNWQLPHVQEELLGKSSTKDRFWLEAMFLPLPVDVGYHSPVPKYDGQEPIPYECDLVKGGVCYYDGSGLQANDVFQVLLTGGSDAVWEELEKRYVRLFGELK